VPSGGSLRSDVRRLPYLPRLVELFGNAAGDAREIFVESPLAHPSVMMRREWLGQVGGYQDRDGRRTTTLAALHLPGCGSPKCRILLAWREPQRATHRSALSSRTPRQSHYLMRDCVGGSVLVWGGTGRRLSNICCAARLLKFHRYRSGEDRLTLAWGPGHRRRLPALWESVPARCCWWPSVARGRADGTARRADGRSDWWAVA
jgi:hypothetical protein